MSFDLAVWYSPHALDPAGADAVYQALAEGREPPADARVAASPRVAAFLAGVSARYPDLDALPESETEDSPWACGFDASDRHAILMLRWSAADAVPTLIMQLAAEHGLVLYDPQGGDVHLPPDLESSRRPWPFRRR